MLLTCAGGAWLPSSSALVGLGDQRLDAADGKEIAELREQASSASQATPASSEIIDRQLGK